MYAFFIWISYMHMKFRYVCIIHEIQRLSLLEKTIYQLLSLRLYFSSEISIFTISFFLSLRFLCCILEEIGVKINIIKNVKVKYLNCLCVYKTLCSKVVVK